MVIVLSSTPLIASLSAVAGVVFLLLLAKIAERLQMSGDFNCIIKNIDLLFDNEKRIEISLDATSFKKKVILNEICLVYKNKEGETCFSYCYDLPLSSTSSNNVIKNEKGRYGIYVDAGLVFKCIASFKVDSLDNNCKAYLTYNLNNKTYGATLNLNKKTAYYVHFYKTRRFANHF